MSVQWTEILEQESNICEIRPAFGAANMFFSCIAYFWVENRATHNDDSGLGPILRRLQSRISYFFLGDRGSGGSENLAHVPADDVELRDSGLPQKK